MIRYVRWYAWTNAPRNSGARRAVPFCPNPAAANSKTMNMNAMEPATFSYGSSPSWADGVSSSPKGGHPLILPKCFAEP